MPSIPSRRRAYSATVVAVAALLAGPTACTSGPGGADASVSTKAAAEPRTQEAGGVLDALSLGPVLSWDPQRIGTREEAAFAERVFVRTLTAYAPSTGTEGDAVLVGDLATDTGRPSADLRTWSFTLRDGVTWQDGSPVTCEDVRYGVSRTFATDVITGGATDALAVLDVPKQADGTSSYAGPYATGKTAESGRAAFDKALSCDGSSIVFRLSAPVGDFNEMLTQTAFAPFKRERDEGRGSTYDVFSTGPYQLEGEWKATTGGTWVRNPQWQPDTDPIREAHPDRIRYEEGLEAQGVTQRIVSDERPGRTSVALSSAPPALHQQITAVESLTERSINPHTGLVDYLVPNLRSQVFATPSARRALAAATNRDAYVTALGGDTTATPATSLIPAALPAHHEGDPVGTGTAGDPARARALLAEAGLDSPVPLRVAYRQSQDADKAMAALAAGWTEGGFAPELEPLDEAYFTTIAKPASAKAYDVFWSSWAPVWASASTIFPALFDSTVNITAAGPGRDYGYWVDKATNARMGQIAGIADRDARERAWANLDTSLLAQGAYVGLAEQRALHLAGSDVRNLSANEVAGGAVELADIAVKQ